MNQGFMTIYRQTTDKLIIPPVNNNIKGISKVLTLVNIIRFEEIFNLSEISIVIDFIKF